jgi:hypothetical protein
MRQEVDIRYVVTSLKGSARHLYENVYCQRGQMENLIKLHVWMAPAWQGLSSDWRCGGG